MRALFVSLAVLIAACSPSGGNPIPPSPAPGASAATSPLSSGACIDRADLADRADVVTNVMQAIATDLKASNVAQAKADVASASTGLRKLADLVGPVQPSAAQDVRSAADELESAGSQLPAGQSLIDKAQTDFAGGLALARAAACPG